MRAARSSSYSSNLPASVRGLARCNTSRILSISRNVASIFFAGILACHFSPFRQNNSRAFGSGAAITEPSGVSLTASNFEASVIPGNLRDPAQVLPVRSPACVVAADPTLGHRPIGRARPHNAYSEEAILRRPVLAMRLYCRGRDFQRFALGAKRGGVVHMRISKVPKKELKKRP